MDFSKFRETGELSDITVVVNEREFKLHKFPLYIKSDFFRALARSKITERDRVELADFPGGELTFEEVANFFYNIKVNITKDNVCKLRCAAEFLQMTSSANLADLTDRFLQDNLTSAKLSKNLDAITDLLTQCCDLGAIAEQAGVVNKCITAIVDCWLISTKFVRKNAQLDKSDLSQLQKLTQFPLNWFLLLFITARDKAVRPAVLATLIELYINNVLHKQDDEPDADILSKELVEETAAKKEDKGNSDKEEKGNAVKDEEEKQAKQDKTKKEEVKENAQPEAVNGIANEAGSGDNLSGDNKKKETKQQDMKPSDEDMSKKKEPKQQKLKPSDENISEVLDTLLQELPENTPLAETINPQWALKMLNMSEKVSDKSRSRLLKLVACLLHKFSPADLSQMSPDLLSEILMQAGDNSKDAVTGQKIIQTSLACQVKTILYQHKVIPCH